MSKIIALFNHKGGVSKTTTTFNLGWALADLGKRVMIVDGDPQCNLTGTVLGFSGQEDFESLYESGEFADIGSCLNPIFQSGQTQLQPGKLTDTNRDNLKLLAGNIDLAQSEGQLAVAIKTGTSALPALKNLPGAIPEVLRITADENDIDVVLLDMSPSVGALNHCFLMACDYFIVPTFPDYFCNQAVRSLGRILPQWDDEIGPFRTGAQRYKVPELPPKFIGIISQRYRPYGDAPASSFQKWIDRIKGTVEEFLVPELEKNNMTISKDEFRRADPEDTPYNLINIPEFNSLMAISQRQNTPVFALSEKQINQTGVVLSNMIKNRDKYKNLFHNLGDTVIEIAGI